MSGGAEILTGPERRRRWSEEEKLQVVEEACRPGHSVSQVARQRGINPSQLFTWRRQARAKGLISDARSGPSVGPALTFTPVNVVEQSSAVREDERPARRRSSPARGSVVIKIELKGGERMRVEVPADVDLV